MVLLKDRGQKTENRRQIVGYRKILRIFLLLLLSSVIFSNPSSVAYAESKVYIIKIEGMHCKMCQHRITKSLKKLKEVKEVEVDLDEGTATVLLNDGVDVDKKTLETAVEDAGYKPVGVK